VIPIIGGNDENANVDLDEWICKMLGMIEKFINCDEMNPIVPKIDTQSKL